MMTGASCFAIPECDERPPTKKGACAAASITDFPSRKLPRRIIREALNREVLKEISRVAFFIVWGLTPSVHARFSRAKIQKKMDPGRVAAGVWLLCCYIPFLIESCLTVIPAR